jgi:cytochrome c553
MTKTKLSVFVALLTLFTTIHAQASEGDPIAGKDKSAMCQGCHGEEGISVNPMCPNLAGQFSRYIKKQIRDFQAERRNDPMMSPMAATITEPQDLEDIAAYFGSRKSMLNPPSAATADIIEHGKDLYTNGNPETGLYGCINCHGDNGKGKSASNPMFPVIGGQAKDYVVKQLNDLRSGERKNDPAGMMGNIAKKMTDVEIDAVAEYLSGLQ